MQELMPNIFNVYRDEGSGGWGYSYFVKRPQGNLFFARMAKTAAIQQEYMAIQASGGIQRIYITDFHFAGSQVEDVARQFDADIYCSKIEVSKIKKQGVTYLIAFDYTRFDIEPDLTVIPTPGHTNGGVCYLLTLDNKRYLFTGDFLYFDGKQWVVGSKNYNSIKDSLDRLQTLEFDVLLGCGDDALGRPWIDLSVQDTKTMFFDALRQQYQ